MYAIVEVGAKQYNVKTDDIIDVEKQDALEGAKITLDKVMLLSTDKEIEVGKPYLKGTKVNAVVLKQIKARKVVSFKYRSRKSSHWKKGHRQSLTRLKIKEIETG